MSKDNNNNDNDQVNWGFKKVLPTQKEQLVTELFSSITQHYDLMNNIMSFGIHHLWKKELCNYLFNLQGSLIDVACGTGDIAFNFYRKAIKYNVTPNITMCDINYDMLMQARERAVNNNMLENICYINCNAESLPFASNSFDNFSVAFGIRNVANMASAIAEAHRVLKPGGRFVCLEFAKVDNACVRSLYDLYSFAAIPLAGKFFANNWQAYQYLVESIRTFPCQQEFCCMLTKAGFQHVKYRNLTLGIVAIYSASKL